jgi:pimeloyl-ACP methyl ester carboxylesterase
MLQKNILCHSSLGFHHIAFTEWGNDATRPPIICVHGLTRNGRDFDRLAAVLDSTRRIFCPDMAGRGKSDWLSDPSLYGYSQYINDITALIARTGAQQVDWVGTSMGGILGMLLAAEANTPVRRLIINDVGPFIPLPALQRIANYVGLLPEFADAAQAERHLRQIYAPFGIMKDEDWKHTTANSLRVLPNGKLTLAHDPAIAKNFSVLKEDISFWDVYDRIQCPTLLIRGALSDILSKDTADEMTRRGPKPKLVEFANVGHAPALVDAEQIAVVKEFLAA